MQIVDDERMGVAAAVPVFAQVRVVRVEFRMIVLDLLRIGGRPEAGRQARAEQGDSAQDEKRGGHSGRAAEPASG